MERTLPRFDRLVRTTRRRSLDHRLCLPDRRGGPRTVDAADREGLRSAQEQVRHGPTSGLELCLSPPDENPHRVADRGEDSVDARMHRCRRARCPSGTRLRRRRPRGLRLRAEGGGMSEIVARDIPPVPSPYEGQTLDVKQHVSISAYWFATNFMWGALLTIMLPAEVEKIAPYSSVPALAILTGISAIIALVVPLIAGALSDRCAHPWGRRRPFMAVGIVTNLVGLVLLALTFAIGARSPIPKGDISIWGLIATPSFLGFLVAYLVVQFGNNITSAAYSGIIPDLVPSDQRGKASGYMALMSQLGTLFGAVGSGVLLGGQSEPVKYVLLGLVLAGVGAITLFGIRETPLPAKPPKIEWASYVKSLWIDPRQHPDFAWVWITRALVMLGFYSVLPFVNYYLRDVVGSKDVGRDAAMVLGIILIASTISAIQGGKISDRIGRKKVVYLANAVIAVMALGFIFCRSLPQVIGVGLLFGLGFGAYTSVDWALGTDVLPSKEDAAKEMAVWHIAMTLPQSLAAPAASWLITRFGMTSGTEGGKEIAHYTIAGYSSVFILCSVCFAAGAYLLKNVRGVK
ncbi:MFS transporter [bacterium]|nr:MAG: MFS transporter [bacterium]